MCFFVSLQFFLSKEKFSVIEKQKDRFGVIFLLLWLSEHTQGGGVVSGVSYHKYIVHTIGMLYIYCSHLEFEI